MLCPAILSPLQVAAGREWYIHTIYSVRSRENAHRNMGKRSLEYHHSVSSAGTGAGRSRRAVEDEVEDIGPDNNKGTNIQHIALDRSDRQRVSQRQPWSDGDPRERPLLESSGKPSDGVAGLPMMVGLASLVLLLCLTAIAVALLVRRKKRGRPDKLPPYSTSSCSAYQGSSSSRETVSTGNGSEV